MAPHVAHDPALDQVRATRRTVTIWLAACVLGAGLVLLTAGRTWATVALDPRLGTPGAGEVTLSGNRLSALLGPAALTALAATAAVFATRGLARRAIGVVIALCGIAVAAGAWTGTRSGAVAVAGTEHATAALTSAVAVQSIAWAWPVLTMAGGAILLAGGVLAVARGGRWPGMSSRYDRPAGADGHKSDTRKGVRVGRATGDRALWDAIDEGADPTLESHDSTDGGPQAPVTENAADPVAGRKSPEV